MVFMRRFQLSDPLFWGFRAEIDLCEVDSVEEIVAILKERLSAFLLSQNLQVLSEILQERNFHAGEPFGSILTSENPGDTVYLCSHHCHHRAEPEDSCSAASAASAPCSPAAASASCSPAAMNNTLPGSRGEGC